MVSATMACLKKHVFSVKCSDRKHCQGKPISVACTQKAHCKSMDSESRGLTKVLRQYGKQTQGEKPLAAILYWRKGWDSNPRYGITVYRISSPAHSTSLPPFQDTALSSRAGRSLANFRGTKKIAADSFFFRLSFFNKKRLIFGAELSVKIRYICPVLFAYF